MTKSEKDIMKLIRKKKNSPEEVCEIIIYYLKDLLDEFPSRHDIETLEPTYTSKWHAKKQKLKARLPKKLQYYFYPDETFGKPAKVYSHFWNSLSDFGRSLFSLYTNLHNQGYDKEAAEIAAVLRIIRCNLPQLPTGGAPSYMSRLKEQLHARVPWFESKIKGAIPRLQALQRKYKE